MIKRMRIQLTLICTLGTLLVLVAMVALALVYPERQLNQQAEEIFTGNLNTVITYLSGQKNIEQVRINQIEASEGILVRIDDGGRPLQYVSRDPKRAQLTAAAQRVALAEYEFDNSIPVPGGREPVTIQFVRRWEGQNYRAAVSAVPVANGWVGVTVVKSAALEEGQILQLRIIFALSVALAAICLFLFAWFFTGKAIRPVEESNRKQAEFISAASHELRSPLAVMQASAGAMQTAPLEKARMFARNIEGECMRLSRLAGDLLTLASSDSQRWTIQKALAEPETLLLQVGERFEPLARQKGLTLTVELPEETLPRCSCDPERIQQLLAVLVDNAVSYTPAGGRITLCAGHVGRRGLQMSVSDTGPGVPDQDKQQIFDRFYRGDASRTQREHYGLGLSIAREIAILHRGTLTVGDAPGGGACFILTLPL